MGSAEISQLVLINLSNVLHVIYRRDIIAGPLYTSIPVLYTMTTEVSSALLALEQLASSTSTSSSGPLNALLDQHFSQAKKRILEGDNPRSVILDLQKSVNKAKKDVEKGLKGWYGALGTLGKSVDKVGRVAI